jgi:hypothetical protein
VAIAANYLTLQQQIADELGDRQDLLAPLSDSSLTLSPIQNAIQSAIAKWEREPFYFNQVVVQTPASGPYAVSTASGQEYYGAATSPSNYAPLATFAKIRKAWVLIAANRYTINERTPQYLDDVSVNPSVTGEPIDWAYAGQLLRLYPIPNGSYPLGFEAIQRLAALANPADANAWTQDGYDLIRCEAKLMLAEEVLHDTELAALMQRAIYGDPAQPHRRGYLDALKAETTRRSARGRIRASHF